MTVFKGIPASRGIALAKCYKFDKHIFDIDKTLISNDKVEHELSRFKNSKLKAKTQIQELINKLIAIDKNDSKIEIFNAHLEIIDDPMLSEAVELGITEDKKQAPYSLHTATQDISSMLLNLDDIYLRERVADIKDISSRIMYSLHGSSMETLENLEEECIVIARDLTPSDTGTMDTSKVMGFATDIGGKT